MTSRDQVHSQPEPHHALDMSPMMLWALEQATLQDIEQDQIDSSTVAMLTWRTLYDIHQTMARVTDHLQRIADQLEQRDSPPARDR